MAVMPAKKLNSAPIEGLQTDELLQMHEGGRGSFREMKPQPVGGAPI